jgi:cytosine/adenosine deaminase-related metal-dependent hydrolase
VYRRNCDVVFTDDRITHVGPGFLEKPDRTIDGRSLMVMPGLIDLHSHPMFEPLSKGWNDEIASQKLWGSALYEIIPTFLPELSDVAASATVAYGELLLSGTTTTVDIAFRWDGWIDLFAKSGMRGVLAPMYRSAYWYTKNGHSVEYEWNEDAGRRDMDAALALIDKAAQHPSGRLSGMLAPAQVDTCTAELLRASVEEAKRRGLKCQVHAAQSVVEFHEMTRRHGKTPIEWMASLGLLGPDMIIGHGVFLDHHTSVSVWPTKNDLSLLADSGAFVAHCPTQFLRKGVAMQSLGRYLARGVGIGIGTDTYPHNMIEEMRAAVVTSRLASGNVWDLRTSDVFNAATLGGAAALGRDDIGRIAPGAKADLVLIDVTHPTMRPVRDPIRSLIYAAAERPVRAVFVDGRAVVEDRKLVTLDLETASAEVEQAQRRIEAAVAGRDWAGRDHAEISPYTYELV